MDKEEAFSRLRKVVSGHIPLGFLRIWLNTARFSSEYVYSFLWKSK